MFIHQTSVVAVVSAAEACADAGGTPAATVKIREGGLRSVRRGKAEREREGSAAKSIQRTKKRRADRCRVTAAQQPVTDTQRRRLSERENSRRRIWHRHVPNLSRSREQQRARLCSTALPRIVPFAVQAWNEMGSRFEPCRSSMRPPRMRNDSRRRSTSRSQSPRRRNGQSFSSSMLLAGASSF